jgi:hypothetical protein
VAESLACELEQKQNQGSRIKQDERLTRPSYCMVQFSDEPHWMKGVAVYLLPSALTVMSIVATILRIVGAIHPWSDGVRAANPVIFTRTTWLARASVATALALAGCFIIVVPYTAMQRRHRRMLSRGSGINHSQVAAMVQSGSFHKMTGYEPGAVLGLMFIGVCLMIEAVYRVMLVDTTRVLGLSTSWFRGQVAVDILCVLPEWIALLTVTLLDFEAMHNGTVELRWYWQDVVIYTHPSVEELPIEASEASFWTSRPLIPEGPKTLSTSTVASPPRYGDSPISPTTLRLSQASFMSPNMNMSPPPPQRGPPHRTHLQVPVTTLSTPILPSEVTPTGSTPILLKQFPSPPLSHASQHTASTSQTEHTASTFGHAGGERARDRYSEQASFDQYIKEEAA